MLLLEWQSKAIDYGAEYFQQLSNAIEPFCFVNELKEDVVDRASDEGSQVQELAVYSVEGRLQEVSLSRILGIKEFQ